MFHFPPIVPRFVLEQSGYLQSFPDLLGSIDVFEGNDELHGELLDAWSGERTGRGCSRPSEVTLCSAGCHPLYPLLSGGLPAGGRRFECFGQCFRHEPSLDPARMQSFRQHEFVYVGEPENAVGHRDLWLERSAELLSGLGLEVESVVANDPFFGRAGRMLAANQRSDAFKYEVTSPIQAGAKQTAIASWIITSITSASGSPSRRQLARSLTAPVSASASNGSPSPCSLPRP